MARISDFHPGTMFLPDKCVNHTSNIGDEHGAYKLVMGAMGLLQIPFFCLSVYCILKRSPWIMGYYKWMIFLFQLAIITFNMHLTILTLPIMFYPYLCGYTNGLLTSLEVPTKVQYVMATFSLACVGASTTCLFEYRHHSVLPNFHFLRHSCQYRVFKHFVYYATGVFHVILPIFFVRVEEKSLLRKVFDEWQEAPCEMWSRDTIVMSTQKLGFLHFYYMAGIVFVIVLSSVYAGHSFYIIRATRILLSKEMQKMQRKLLNGLLLQVLIPYSALCLPALIGLIALLLTGYFCQSCVQVGLILISSHGLLSTITTIMAHQSYRNYLFFLCRRMFLPIGVKVSTVDELTTMPNLRKLGTHTHITKI